MCKYNSYAIEIVHLNGNKQLREAEDNTSYKDTMALYNKVKEEYIDHCAIINFVGLAKDNEQKIIFIKKNSIIEGERRNIEDLTENQQEFSHPL